MPLPDTGRASGRRTRQHHCRAPQLLLSLLLAFTLNAQSLLHIRVVEGQGTIHAAGSRSSRPLIVEITDETGKPVSGAAVSFRLPEEGPGGTFPRGLRSEIVMTNPDGRAGIHEIVTSTLSGPFQIRVTAVRDSVRAGTVVDQYISETVTARRASPFVSPRGRSRRRVLWIALAAGGAAATLAFAGGGGRSASTPAAPAAPPSVGMPVLTIGRP